MCISGVSNYLGTYMEKFYSFHFLFMNASWGCKKVKMHISALSNYLGACRGILFWQSFEVEKEVEKLVGKWVNNQVEKGVQNSVRKPMKNGAKEVEKPLRKWVNNGVEKELQKSVRKAGKKGGEEGGQKAGKKVKEK